MPVRVLLADDSEIIRRSIVGLLMSEPEIHLIGEATSFAQTMELASKLGPQVVIMDLHMKDENLVTPSLVKERLVDSQLLAISIWNDQETKDLAATYGAAALLDKANLAMELIPAIKRCAK